MPRRPELSDRIAIAIRDSILAERWEDGRLPSERELAQEHGVARLTVRRALQRLCAETLIEARPGVGYALASGAAPLMRRQGGQGRTVLFFFVRTRGYSALDPIDSEIVQGAGMEAGRHGIELYATCQDPAVFRRIVTERAGTDLRGVLLDWANPEIARFLIEAAVPFVVIEDDLEGMPVAAVLQDNAGGVRRVLTHLANQGHRRIGLIANNKMQRIHSMQRQAAYREFTIRQGWDVEPELLAVVSPGEGRSAAARLLDLPKPPTAVFVASRGLLTGVVEEMRARGMSYPKDLSLAAWGTPDRDPKPDSEVVTHVTWDRQELGRLAMRVLEDRIRLGHGERMVMKIETRLVDCGSVARLGEDEPVAGMNPALPERETEPVLGKRGLQIAAT